MHRSLDLTLILVLWNVSLLNSSHLLVDREQYCQSFQRDIGTIPHPLQGATFLRQNILDLIQLW